VAKFLFNFKSQFVPKVESGEKTQTIRANRNDGRKPVPGDIACLYSGLRTRNTKLIGEHQVVSCRSVRIHTVGNGELIVDGIKLDAQERLAFAKADGFNYWPDMVAFFRDQYMVDVFEGFCVQWEWSKP